MNTLRLNACLVVLSIVTMLFVQPGNAAVAVGAAPGSAKARPIPFHGKLAAVNPAARTLTVGKRTFQITTETKIFKVDKTTAGTLSDGVVGAPVTGSYIKSSDGKLLARSVYFKPAATVSASEAVPAQRPASPPRK